MPLLQDGEGSNYLYCLLTLVSETWGMVPQCQISPGDVVQVVELKVRVRSTILPAALPIRYY